MADTQEEPLFDPSLKKKKGSKKTVDFSGLDDEPASAPAAAEGSSTDATPADAAPAEDDMFGGLKKKKKSKKAIPMDLDLVRGVECVHAHMVWELTCIPLAGGIDKGIRLARLRSR